MLQEGTPVQFLEGLFELFLGVHHDGAVPGDRFLQRLAGYQQKADAILAGLDFDFVAAVEEDQRAIVGLRGRCGVQPADAFCGDEERAEALQNLPSPANT